ncbi:hypothetical protein N0V84_004068 [Fusarium piperis]|uniref:Agglutinin-like protein 2 n=1 Tax=Fusarium piperis TaxID=1435070 RepID=A0A9W9BQS9_9HYPO|nr:hypothetical protein N0V84_004068 [Fusarium piperis]
MWLSRGLLASTLITAIKAQDDNNNNDVPSLDIPDLATQIRGSIFDVSLIPHAETTLSGGHGTLNDNDDAFPATAFPHDQSAPGGASPNTPVAQQPPTITIPPSTDYPYERIIKAYTGTRTIINVITTIAEPSGTRAGTVIVELASTLYSAFIPGQSGALTIPPSLEDPMFTVIQAFPGPTTLPPRTITIPASGTNPGTVIIQTPWPETPNTVAPGSPGAPDAGSPDAGSPDSGSPDSGAPGAGSPDSGSPGAGSPDSGSPGADVPGAGSPGSPGSADTSNVVMIQTYTGTISITRPVLTTITAPGGGQGTVVIQVPPGTQGAGETVTIPPSADSPFTTILRPHTGPTPISTAVTILIPPTAAGDGGTIVIETPTPDSGDTGIIDPGNKVAQPGNELPTGQRNVVVTLPSDPNSPFVTIVQGHDGTGTITVPTTITIQPSGGEKGTVIIETPNAPAPTRGSPITIAPGPGGSTTTIVREHTGDPITVPTTITITGAPGQPGTIIIETPSPNSPQTGTRPADEPITIPSGPDSPTTIFRPHVGDPITEPITLTIAPSGGQPGTVVIETPAPSTPQPGQETITIPAGGDNPWATIVRPHPGDPITSAITITQTPVGNEPGTIIIETPVTKVQQTPTAQTPSGAQTSPGAQTGPDGSVQTSQPGDSGNGELTIPPSRDNPYITIYRPHTGDPITAPIAITQPPANGQPGTIIIETPATRVNFPTGTEPITIPTASDRPYVTIYRPHTGDPITEPITITQPPANGQPGTIIIETPAPEVTVAPTSSGGYITVFRPHTGDPITAPITITVPASNGLPGTVYIETPPPIKWAQTQSSAQQPTTVSGSDGYITIYTPYPGPGTIDTPITIVTPPRDGQPGTVLIETPVPQTPTQGPVETPEPATTVSGSDGYVTIYTPYPGPGKISSPITIITPPQGGRPGTVLIETPVPDPTQPQQSGPATVTDPERWVTIYTPFPGPGTISQPITITQPPANGQPGTILIETPVPQSSSPSDFYVTVYRPYPGPGTITTPITLTQPPANGQPGTIFIETPAPPTQTPTPTVPQTSAGPITIPPGPTGPYVTIYRPYPGPGTITAPITYTQPPANGQPGTVIIETPVSAAPSTTETPGGTLTVPTASDRPYVTIYRPYPGPGNIDHPITITQPPANGQPGTIIIETPTPVVFTKFAPTSRPPVTVPAGDDNYITIYRPHTGAPITAPITVTTIAPSGGQPGTVIIETPAVVESTEAQTTSDSAVTIPQGQDGYVTVYRPHTGSPITAPITVTTILPSGGQPGTVIIETPVPLDPTQPETTTAPPPVTIPADQGGYVTIYRPYPGPGSITAPLTVGTIAPSGGRPGTVIIETPVPQTPTETQSPPVTVPQGDDGYVTVYRPYPGPGVITAPLTVTTIAPSGGQPGTVIIETPVPQTPAPTQPATVTASEQNGYITIYRPYTGASAITVPITVTTIPPSGGQPGTVIIETLVPQTPTETQSSGNPPVTIPPGPDNSYVTVYRPYPGPGVITAPVTVTTIAPSGGQPGTIIIETPVPQTPTPTADPPVTIPPGPENSYVTVYRPHEGPDQITAPITVTTIEPTNGLPGTIIIETPGLQTGNKVNIPPVTLSPGPQETYVTVYRPHTGADVITAPVTVTTITPSNGQPGTVIIETPEPQSPEPNPTVTIPPGPEESYVTVFRPHTGADVITAPITITTIAPSGGQPGTVIIETPVQPDPTTSTPEAAPTTVSSPGASYITVYRPHTGVDVITAPVTVTTIPPFGDQPGTVIIETPVEAQPTSTQEAPTTVSSPGASYITVYRPHTGPDVITAPVTVTTIPPSGDQPGTVIIETPAPVEPSTPADEPTTVSSPGATYLTVYRPHTGPDVITAPVTVTTIPPSGDQPGTVIIETPTDPEPTPAPAPAPPLTTSRPGASYLTVYRPHTGADEITGEVTITTIDPTDDQPGTIVIETPIQRVAVPTTSSQADYYVTVYRPHAGLDVITEPVTVTTIAPSDGQPGTVIIETPGPQAPPVTTSGPAPSYITITRPYTGQDIITAPITVTTIPPQGDEPGTVIIETPTEQAAPVTSAGPAPSYVTVYRPHTGPDEITAPVTVTTIAPTGDQPGTVIIETPGPQAPPVTTAGPAPSYITIYRPYSGTDVITGPVTVTTIAPEGDQPGTVIIETPGQAPATTTSGPAPSWITVYRPYSGVDIITAPITVSTIQPDGDQPGTIIIETPVERVAATTSTYEPFYVTVFRPYPGPGQITAPITVTTIAPEGDQPGTVIIETPGQAPPVTATPEPSYVTVFRPYTGTGVITEPTTVTTIEPQGDQPGTVIVETPGQAPPVTASPEPEPSYVTVYRPYPGPGEITAPVTVTTIPPSGIDSGTVIIETPGQAPPVTSSPEPEPSYVTVYRPYPGPGEITAPVTVTTIEPSGTEPGTVIIETPGQAPPVTTSPQPEPSYVTVYRPYPGPGEITAPVTVTTIEASGTEPGTVIIETPGQAPPITSSPEPEPSYVTVYRPYPGPGEITAPVTVTTIEPSGTDPGTVIIETPGQGPPVTSSPEPSYITVYRPYPGPGQITEPVTVTTIEPQGTEPGTVIIETPGQAPPITTSAEPSYITVYRPYPGPGQITEPVTVTTIEPSGTEPGTVIIETPGQAPPVITSAEPTYVTVYRPYPGPGQITEPVTVTTIEPTGTEPGTVIIETPGQAPPVTTRPEPSWITIFRAYTGTPMITESTTVTTIDPQGDEPGTVIIETPALVTSSPVPSWITIFRPYTGTPMITEPTTVTTIDPQGDEPGTVIIETPGQAPPITATPEPSWITIYRPYTGTPPITEPTTVTTIDPQGDQPGTVIVETPGQAPPVTASPEPSYITVYRAYTGVNPITGPVTVTTIPPDGDQPGTVVIETPVPATTSPEPSYITIFRPFTGTPMITSPITVTTIEPQGDQPGTVIIETPGQAPPITATPEPSYVTVYRPYPGPGEITAPVTVTTIEPQGDQPGTVIIETPGQAPPVTAAPAETTEAPTTTPPPTYITVFRPYPGPGIITAPFTVTTIEPQGDQPGTVIIETPGEAPPVTATPEPSYITVFRPYHGPGEITAPITVTTIEPQGDQPGTVIIETPGQAAPVTAAPASYVTVYTVYTGAEPITGPITVTTIPPQGDEPGIVVIETPGPEPTTSREPLYITVYRPHSGPDVITAPVTVTTIEPQGDQPGTVIIETPGQAPPVTTAEPSYITIWRAYTGVDPITNSITVTTIPPQGDQPGTVIIETPVPQPTTSAEPSYITVYRPYPGPGQITAPVTVTTIEPQGDQPGTVIIETPGQAPPITTSEPAPEPSYITVYRPYPGPGQITAPVTVTTIEPQGDQPGTVIIETPGQAPPITTSEPAPEPSYITVYRPYPGPGEITAPVTVTTIEPQGDQPGTVIIETPGQAPPITTSEPAPEPSYVTVYRPYPGPGEITAPVTVTTIEPQGDQPGTVIIETPGQAPPITTSEAEPTYITVYRPYPGPGQITAPVTVTTIEPQGTEPGTVIIETPGQAPPITTSEPAPEPSYITVYRPYPGPGQITAPVTVTTIEPQGTEPGTVIIETPGQAPPITTSEPELSYITITRPYSGVDPITGPITVTTIPPTGTDPGTVIIETPVAQTTSEFDPSYITITRPYRGIDPITGPITVTTIPPTGTDPGTVIIETPEAQTTSVFGPSYITITRPYSGVDPITGPITVTTIPPTGTDPGTVIIETPVTQTTSEFDPSYITITRPYRGVDPITGPITITTIPPTGTGPGTVIVETPEAQTTSEFEPSYITIYRPYSGVEIITGPTTVTTIPPQGTDPGTVIIETPGQAPPITTSDPEPSYITITRAYTGAEPITAPITVTTIPPTGTDPGTVIIETPSTETSTGNPPVTVPAGADSYVTVFRAHTGPDRITAPVTVTTIEPTNGQPGTVIIETPEPEPSTTAETTESIPEPANAPVTLPPGDDSYVTVFRSHTGPDRITEPVTVTTIAPANGQPGTVIIETPDATTEAPPITSAPEPTYVTIYRPYTGSDTITAPVTVTTIAPTNGEPGTVIIETQVPQTQSDSYVTVYRPYTGTASITEPITVTTIAPTNGEPGTVIIETLAPQTESPETQPPTTEPPAITIPPSRSSPNVTIIRPFPGPGSISEPRTNYVAPTADGEPGTIIIETPVPETTSLETTSEVPIETTTAPPAVTIPPSDDSRNVTVIRQYPGPGTIDSPITSYEPPSGPGQPGTVIIETPAPVPATTSEDLGRNVTVYTAGPSTLTEPYTTYSPPGSPGDPGTVIIETPVPQTQTDEGRNVTVYTPGPPYLTAPLTRFQPATAAGEPGTVIIETPVPTTAEERNVTIYTAGPSTLTEPYTTYVPPATPGDPGTVIIETPVPVTAEERNVTIITEGPESLTAPFTTYSPPGSPGDPGTVIIETPGPRNVTITRPGPESLTAPFTTYSPPGSTGDPGTVIVETPGPGNVTITREGPTFFTTYSPPGASGDPGTFIIETPAERNVTVIEEGPPELTEPYTTYSPPRSPGEPGTIIIDTPRARFQNRPTTTTPDPETTSESTEAATINTPTAPTAFTTEPITEPVSTDDTTSSNPDALTITPDDKHDHITVVEPNTEYPGVTDNITHIIPPTDGNPGTHVIYTPVTDTAESTSESSTDYITRFETITIPGDPSTLTKNDTASGDPETTGLETNVIIIPPSGTEPGTVLIHTSVYLDQTLAQHGNVTITRAGPPGVTTPFTTYQPPAQGTDPGTIIIETPDYNVTITRAAPESITTTFTTYSPPANPGDPGTVIVETPDYNVTITREAPASITTPFTTYNPPGTPGDPGTVIVETPNGDYNITITRAAPQSVTTLFTTYSPPASKGDPGTIIVETPDYNVTITREAPASITTPFTTYNPPGTPGDPGTVVVETPNGDYNVTITRAGPASITTPFTTYSPPATRGDPGTVIVETPDYNVTITRAAPPSVTTPFTTYSPPGTPGDPGTVIVETPDYNVTITRAGPSSVTTRFTTYSPPGSAGDPGTIIIETPDYNVTVTRSGPTSWTTYSPPASADDPGTIFIDVPEDRVADPTTSDEPTTAEESRNVTITRAGPSTATGVFTTYEPPATRGDPGTIIIETPLVRVAGNVPTTAEETTTTEETTTLEEPSASNVTITQVVSTITRPYTTYSPAGARGDPGTVIIQLPPDHNVTITEYVSSRTAPYTTYSPAAVRGDPNTVVIELPPERNVTTTEYVSTITAPYTTYSPPGAAGDPGTIIIELPPERNVTTTEYVSTITAPYTTYSPPGAAGDPGTIIIELPPERNVTTTEYVSTITAPYTTYSPPGAAGDPGTIIIELPPERNVTTTEYVSTITAAYTTYSPPASPGDPGTIIIELPPDRNVTITEEVSTITAPYTKYSPPGAAGDPGTVIVELPPDSNVTITTEVETITEPYTTYSPPANRGDSGTIIIELPPDRNVTITKEVDTITEPYTTYSAPANRGDPGTVIVELPPDRNVTITTVIETITAAYTTYASPANRGDPGTVIVELPPDHNVTITTEVDTITAPYTTYSPPANRGDPGTIIVEMPPDRNVTITTVVETITEPYTTYSPPANQGDPGTVIIELPPEHNVTITTEVETITEPYTTYSPPANRGDPGTIIVELPPNRNVTTTVAGPSTLTGRYTTYSPPGRAGDPGTIIVETPPAHNITITTEGDETLTGPFTTYIPPESEDEPGTILIETPRARLYNYIFYYVFHHISCTNHEHINHFFFNYFNNYFFYNYFSYNINLDYSAAAATVRFDCDVYGYLFQKTSLYRVEITTGKTTLIKSGIGPGGWINGIGYNRYDDYIYGMVMDDTGSQLIRIGADGGWTLLSARVSNRNVIMGDIDNQGRYWFSDAGRPWWAIDLYPGSSTYGKIILSGTATHDDGMADWAFVPGGGDYMYAIQYTSTSSTLTRFSRTSYTWQTLKAFGNITGQNVWGALYAAADGNLYGSENTSGNIYKFPIAPTIGTPKFLSSGPVSSWNDGARCIDSESIVA